MAGGAGGGGGWWWGEGTGAGWGESACSQAQEGGGPTHQTMPVLRGQNGREMVEMKQSMRPHVDGEGLGLEGSVVSSNVPGSNVPEKKQGRGAAHGCLGLSAAGWARLRLFDCLLMQ